MKTVTVHIPENLVADHSYRCGFRLINENEAQLTFHKQPSSERRKFRQLPHGRVSVGENDVRLSLRLSKSETGIDVIDCITQEADDATFFLEEHMEEKN